MKRDAAKRMRERLLKNKTEAQLKGLGLLDTGPDKRDVTDILVEMEETVKDSTVKTTELGFGTHKPGESYPIGHKVLAILFMETIQAPNKDGEMIPRFSLISKWLDTPKKTIHDWWQKRDTIMQQKNAVIEKGFEYVQLQFMKETMRMVNAMGQIDYTKMFKSVGQMQNFVRLMDMITLRVRLYGKLSTENIAHQHSHHGRVALVLQEDQK